MDFALIVCISGVMYAGKLLSDYNDKALWTGIKPSPSSDICLYFNTNRIKKIFFLDGTSATRIETDLKEKPEYDLDIPQEDVVLIRVKGGVSFRGQNLKQLPEGIPFREGYWISTSAVQETLVYIPEHEIEKVYGL
ncbi:MAG: hypothetical protein N2489_04545 [Clostridia bacterium]|nr:hypothetical protein [Clostridia bacterium]